MLDALMWCSCELSSGILAPIPLVLLVGSKSDWQSFTYQHLFLSFFCQTCIKFHIPEMEIPSASSVGFSIFFLLQPCQQVLFSVWVPHLLLDMRRDLLFSHLTAATELVIEWWCSIVTEPYASYNMSAHCGHRFRTTYFLIIMQFGL